ncbi:hypothetical protein TL16_g11131 [Triparma laevis f. inornata]|uniref:Uncharacterized protein n=1 Tax=Triparma laevis f. inornata TaxID=1714386 RepID=A0A9W7BIL0_9STRA|nr:hypothetical protein TL16_g11131 [Triparma laevis f. inornata]
MSSKEFALATAASAGVAIGVAACLFLSVPPAPPAFTEKDNPPSTPQSRAPQATSSPKPVPSPIFKEPAVTRGGSIRPLPIDTSRPSTQSSPRNSKSDPLAPVTVPTHIDSVPTSYQISLLFQRTESMTLSHSGKVKCEQSEPGLCVYVSFSKSTDDYDKKATKKKKNEKDKLTKAAETILNVKLLKQRKKLKDSIGARSLTIIPSANLTSKIKKFDFQYRSQIGQTEAKNLFLRLKDEILKAVKSLEDAEQVRCGFGEFGEMQELKMDCSSGPFMHFLTM